MAVAATRQSHEPAVMKRIAVVVPPGGRCVSVTLPIDHVTPWSPDDPRLYVAHVKLLDGDQTRDAIDTRFGMRSFTVEDGDFLLNGKRVFIKGAFWEGQYPNTLAHPRGMSIVRKEIKMAKQAMKSLGMS